MEIAFFDRGPVNPKELITGGYWSSYWYNGFIYGAEIARGIDIFRLLPSEYLSRTRSPPRSWCASRSSTRRTSRATSGRRASWWRKAYLDQLARAKAIDPAREKALSEALDRGDTRGGRNAAALDELDKMAADLQRDAAVPGAADAKRYKAMAEAITARTARLR